MTSRARIAVIVALAWLSGALVGVAGVNLEHAHANPATTKASACQTFTSGQGGGWICTRP